MDARRRQSARLPGGAGAVLMMAVVFVVVNLAVDLMYGVIDPRIRYG